MGHNHPKYRQPVISLFEVNYQQKVHPFVLRDTGGLGVTYPIHLGMAALAMNPFPGFWTSGSLRLINFLVDE